MNIEVPGWDRYKKNKLLKWKKIKKLRKQLIKEKDRWLYNSKE